MAYHHLALATRDIKATHEFYTAAMGFELVKVAVGPAGKRGFAKHLFYDTGNGELIAFWDLHDDTIGTAFPTAISTGAGLPVWVNHLAFDAPTTDALDTARQRWQDHGETVTEIDHGWCRSIYTMDPNGILVEFCTTTQSFTDADRADAGRVLLEADPEREGAPVAAFYDGRATGKPRANVP